MTKADETTEKILECYKALKMVHLGYDLAAGQLSKQLGVPLCVENCGLCCQINVVCAYGIEAAYAVSNIATDLSTFKLITDRAEGWLRENYPSAPTKIPVVGGEPIALTSGLNKEIDVLAEGQCPFYDSNTKLCLIHQYRPLVCRAFGVTRVAHKDCRRPESPCEHGQKLAYFGGLGATAIKDVLDKLLEEWPTAIGAKSGFFPSLILAIAQPARYRKLAMSGEVSTAKLLLLDDFHGLLWQDQLEQYRKERIGEFVSL
jgi:Fe-S-cluster containining protein